MALQVEGARSGGHSALSVRCAGMRSRCRGTTMRGPSVAPVAAVEQHAWLDGCWGVPAARTAVAPPAAYAPERRPAVWPSSTFPLSLHPVLEGGIRHKHPVVTPQGHPCARGCAPRAGAWSAMKPRGFL